jgi:amino-acid N-acetyltransferase
MSTQVMTSTHALRQGSGHAGARESVPGPRSTRAAITLRTATPAEAPALHALIAEHLEEGRLLPRALPELTIHASRFVVAVRGRHIVGCAELAPLSAKVAEVRSLVVDRRARGLGIGRRMVDELQHQARLAGYERLCAFTHEPGYFVHQGFSIVPHTWVPEKIAHDCSTCSLFRRCGQHAVILPLARAQRTKPAVAAEPAVIEG